MVSKQAAYVRYERMIRQINRKDNPDSPKNLASLTGNLVLARACRVFLEKFMWTDLS